MKRIITTVNTALLTVPKSRMELCNTEFLMYVVLVWSPDGKQLMESYYEVCLINDLFR